MGGSNPFNAVLDAVGGIVNSVGSIWGSDHIMQTPSAAKAEAEQAAKDQQAQAQEDMKKLQLQAEEKQVMTQQINHTSANSSITERSASSPAGSAAALSGSQQSVNQSSGSGTMLTGNQGVDPQSLELGKKTLLGG